MIDYKFPRAQKTQTWDGKEEYWVGEIKSDKLEGERERVEKTSNWMSLIHAIHTVPRKMCADDPPTRLTQLN